MLEASGLKTVEMPGGGKLKDIDPFAVVQVRNERESQFALSMCLVACVD